MAKSKQTFQKSEKEKLKQRKRKEKEEKKAERKANSNKGKGFDSMIAYVDHNGHLTSTPPDPKHFVELKLEDIQLGAHVDGPEEDSDVNSGRIIQFKEEKGYGFIKDSRTKEQIFFHVSNALTKVRNGDMVTFDLSKGPKGIVAVNVNKAE
jgi:cold shock CspA family protein